MKYFIGAFILLCSAIVCASASKAKLSSKAKTSQDQQQLMQVLSEALWQMDAVEREIFRIYSQQKVSPGRSVFGKIRRSLQVELKKPLSDKAFFSCDIYQLKFLASDSIEFQHKCHKKAQFQTFAKFTQLGDQKGQQKGSMQFFAGELADVVGIKTSILNKTFLCQLQWQAQTGNLDFFQCQNLTRDIHKKNLLEWQNIEYKKKGPMQIVAEGQLVEDLWPVRKIQIHVPLLGKIKWVEVELERPATETEDLGGAVPDQLARQNQSAKPPRKQVPAGPVQPAAPVDPRLEFENELGGEVDSDAIRFDPSVQPQKLENSIDPESDLEK